MIHIVSCSHQGGVEPDNTVTRFTTVSLLLTPLLTPHALLAPAAPPWPGWVKAKRRSGSRGPGATNGVVQASSLLKELRHLSGAKSKDARLRCSFKVSKNWKISNQIFGKSDPYTCKLPFETFGLFGLDSSHVLTIMVTVWNHHSWSWFKSLKVRTSICIGMPTVPRRPGAGMPVSMGMPSFFISCAYNTDPGTAQRSRHCSSPASRRAWACDDHVYPRPGLVAYWKKSGFTVTSFTEFPLETQLQDTAHC